MFEASGALQKMEGMKKIKSTSFHQYSWNSEVETTWISLNGWHHKTSSRYVASFFNIPTRNVQNMENKIMMETLWAINRHYSYITYIQRIYAYFQLFLHTFSSESMQNCYIFSNSQPPTSAKRTVFVSILKRLSLSSSTCALTGFFWLLSHVIYLKLTRALYEFLLSHSWLMGRRTFSVSQQPMPELFANWMLSTCALTRFFWLLSHVIYLKLTRVL